MASGGLRDLSRSPGPLLHGGYARPGAFASAGSLYTTVSVILTADRPVALLTPLLSVICA